LPDSDNDVSNLIERTEKQGDVDTQRSEGASFSFSFAKIWTTDPTNTQELLDDDQTDSWAQTLQRITTEKEAESQNEVAVAGRGVRRKAAQLANVMFSFVALAKTHVPLERCIC
jgi:chromodomain-helicase-DNA-binding protein 4